MRRATGTRRIGRPRSRFAPDIIRRVLEAGMPRDVLVNINFPDCPPDEVEGIAVATQGKRDQERLHIDARHDGRGNPYYWIAFGRGAHRRRRARHAISPRSTTTASR